MSDAASIVLGYVAPNLIDIKVYWSYCGILVRGGRFEQTHLIVTSSAATFAAILQTFCKIAANVAQVILSNEPFREYVLFGLQ
jgi:hypothetical protein